MAWSFYNSSGKLIEGVLASSIDSAELVAGAVDLAHMSVNSIDSDQYVDGSIDRVHLAADIIDGTKIADDVINSEHYAAASIDNEHLADNAVDSAELAAGSVDIAHLSASGSASSSTFLAGNNAWAAAGATDISVYAHHGSDISIGNASNTSVPFDSEEYDTDTMHDTSTNNNRITIKTAGKYIFHFYCRWADNGTGVRVAFMMINASTVLAQTITPGNEGGQRGHINLIGMGDFSIDDYVEVQVRQNSGGSLNIETVDPNSPSFRAIKVA